MKVPEILLQELDNFEGVLVVLDGLDEQAVGVASLIGEFLRSAGDLGKSVVGPLNPVEGFSQLLLQILSVVLGINPVLLVDVGNVGQVTDDSGTDVYWMS